MPLFRTGIILLLLAGPCFTFGQNTGFDSFISRVAGQYKVDVAIAPELIPTLDSIRNVGAEITTVQELLYRLLNHTGITYQIIDGNKLMLRREDPGDPNSMLAVLTGVVMDQQTGEPLPYATVYAIHSGSGCNTDAGGRFILPLSDTTGNILISYLGFKQVTIPVGKALQGGMDIRMEVDKKPLEEIIVIVPYRLMGQDYSSQSTDLSGYRFITEDQLLSWNAERLITNLTSYTHYSSDRGIRIRGTEAGNSLIMMDDIPVYDPYHFYNIFGPFNGHYFSSVDIYKNNLPIEYGGRIDGMIQAQSGRVQPKSKLILDTDLLQTSLTTELAITPKICLLAGGRISHTSMLNEDLSDSTVANFTTQGHFNSDNEWATSQQPTTAFYDINLGLTAHAGKASVLTFDFFNSSDQLHNTTITAFETTAQKHEIVSVYQSYESDDEWKNLGFAGGLVTTLSPKTTLYLKAFQSRFDKTVDYTSAYEETRHNDTNVFTNVGNQESNLITTGGKAYTLIQTGEQSKVTTGMEMQHHQVDFTAIENHNPYITESQKETEGSVFEEYSSHLWGHAEWGAGARLTYLESTDHVYVLPNLRMLYTFSSGMSVRGAYSKNLQTLRGLSVEDRFGRELNYLVLSDPDRGYPVLRSDKYMVGTGYATNRLSLDAEFYFKKVDGLASVRSLQPDPSHGGYQPPGEFYRLFTGEGRTYGVDLTVIYKWKKLETSVLYTLSKIEERYDMLFNNEYFSPQEDRRHQVKGSLAYVFGKFRASALLTYKSEAPYLSLVRLSSGHGGLGNADYNTVLRYLPPYFSLDLGLEYSFKCFDHPAMAGVSLINATNHENVSDLQHLGRVSRDGGELYITSQTELLGRTPNIYFRYLIN